MTLILECIAICFVLLLPCVVVIANGIHNGAFLFEKYVQERVVKMGLITKKEIDRNRILYKICTMVVMIAYVIWRFMALTVPEDL